MGVGFLSVLVAGVAAILLGSSGHSVLMILAIVTAVADFWSWGVMHNFATEAAKRRATYTGGFYDITAQEAQAAPDSVTLVNMIATLAGVLLLVTSIVLRLVD